MKSFFAMLPLAALAFAAPAPVPDLPALGGSAQTVTSYAPVKTVESTWATTQTWAATQTKAAAAPTKVPSSPQEVIDVLVQLEIDINLKLVDLNATITVDLEVGEVVKIVEEVLHVVILLVEDVVALLGKVVATVLTFTTAEVTQIVAILVKLIAEILFTVGHIIKDLNLGHLLDAILLLVAQVLVALLKIVATLVPGVLALVGALLKELGLLPLVASLLGLVFELLGLIL